MYRRQLFTGAAAVTMASSLPRFAIAQRGNARTLRFIAQADLAVVDPIITTAYVSRNHAYMVWDTLYGMDENFRAHPQMVQGHTVEDDGKRITMVLRDGLKFHDGEPVRAADAVASIRRWAARDALGQVLFSVLDDLSATDDKTFVFRLKKPFPLIFEALAKPSTPVCFIMPERLARTDPGTAVRELIGSGPFRFKADERVPGSKVVYEKFADYVPRPDGAPNWTSGPKVVNFDRVEWNVIPDAATAASALQNGEMDWWEQPTGDLQPVLKRSRDIVIENQDPTGLCGMARFNHLQPPFNNPAIRRALLGAVSQEDFMTAVIGTDRALWREGVGIFPPGTPLASDAGMEVLTSPRDYDKVKRDLAAAGYKGEKVVLLCASDFPSLNALAQVGRDILVKSGMNVEFVSTDWGSVVQRRASKEPVEKGGWSMFFTFWAGLDMFNPGVQQALRGHGQAAWFGWPTAPKLEELRNAWFDASDAAAQKAIGRDIQLQAFQDVPYLPVGQYFQATAYRRDLTGVLKGLPLFWNVKRG
jgi:peptide/nickel transport system substrate-binding protein